MARCSGKFHTIKLDDIVVETSSVKALIFIIMYLSILYQLWIRSNNFGNRIQLGQNVEVDPEDITVSFDDVKGCDEAKQELQEVVEFLRNPDKFSTLGGKLPKGVLLGEFRQIN